MSSAMEILIGAAGTVGALLAVLLPVIRAQGASMRRELDHVRSGVTEVRRELHAEANAIRADVAEVRRELHALAERVARIEGAMTGPWRPPANGSPSPASHPTPPETTT